MKRRARVYALAASLWAFMTGINLGRGAGVVLIAVGAVCWAGVTYLAVAAVCDDAG